MSHIHSCTDIESHARRQEHKEVHRSIDKHRYVDRYMDSTVDRLKSETSPPGAKHKLEEVASVTKLDRAARLQKEDCGKGAGA